MKATANSNVVISQSQRHRLREEEKTKEQANMRKDIKLYLMVKKIFFYEKLCSHLHVKFRLIISNAPYSSEGIHYLGDRQIVKCTAGTNNIFPLLIL
jgi:hypothetical protein